MREGVALVAVGTVVGMAGAWAAGKVLSAMISVVASATSASASDPLLLVGAPALLASLALLACYLPARRSMSIDPSRALRQGVEQRVRGTARSGGSAPPLPRGHTYPRREVLKMRCGGRGFRVFAGRGPAASDLAGIYEDVGTVLITLSTSSVLSFRFSTSVFRGSATSAIRTSPERFPFERKIFPPVSST